MSGYYPSDCDELIPDHDCNPCADTEFGRIRAAAFIKVGFEFLDPTNLAEWEAAIQNKDVILIPQTNGELPDPSENEVDGFGDVDTKLLGFEYAAQFNDPNYKGNCDFYNAIMYAQGKYRFMYKTSSQGHITQVPVTIIPKQGVENDLNSQVLWKVTVKWKHNLHPCPFDFPEDVLECYIPSGGS